MPIHWWPTLFVDGKQDLNGVLMDLNFINRTLQLRHPFVFFLLTLELPLAPAGFPLRSPIP